MIVYCESNFVLELAYEQSEATYCQQLLAAAKEGRIDLAIPAYSLTEPYETLVRRSKQRTLLHTFITLNSNDFNDDEISNDLDSHHCALFFKFKDGVTHSLSAKE